MLFFFTVLSLGHEILQCNFCTKFMLFANQVKLMANIFCLPDHCFCVGIKDFSPCVLLSSSGTPRSDHIAHHKIISVPQQAPPGIAGLRFLSWWLLQGMVSELGS